MKCKQAGCKQHNMGHMPVATDICKTVPSLPQLDCVLVALSVDVSDVCLCLYMCVHLHTCMLGNVYAAGSLRYAA